MVSDSAGKANCLSRSFWGIVSYLFVYFLYKERILEVEIYAYTLTFPKMSDFTGEKAVEPNTSIPYISIYSWY